MIASVTGGSGMVGRRIVRRLLDEGHSVRVLSRGPSPAGSRAEYFRGSLQDGEVLDRLVSGADMVFHCAAELRDEARMWDVNVEGTRRLLEAVARGRCRYFCHVSSAGVVGRTAVHWVDEETPCAPQNAYEKSKWVAEQLVARGIPGCSVAILRPTNVIDEDRPGAFSYPMRGSWCDRIKVFLKGGECAHVVHAEDVAAAAVFLLGKRFEPPQCFFVGLDEDPANTVAGVWSLYQGCGPVSHLPLLVPYFLRRVRRGPGNRGDVRYSSRKLLSEGFAYQVGLEEAARRLASRDGHG